MAVTSLVALTVGGSLLWRTAARVEKDIGRWLVAAVARESRGVYALRLGEVRVQWFRGLMVVDSAAILTDDAVNGARAQPLAALTGVIHECQLRGLQIVTLVRRRGFVADALGCKRGALGVRVPPPIAATGATRESERRSFLVRMQAVELPVAVPKIRIGEIDFPNVAFDFRSARAGGGRQLFEVESMRWHMQDFRTDPGSRAAARRPLMSGVVEIAATNIFARLGGTYGVHIGTASASLTDSTLDLGRVRMDTVASTPGVRTARPYSYTVATLGIASAALRGFDIGALTLGYGVRARTLVLDTLRLVAAKNARPPANPRPPRRRSPQQWLADLGQSVEIDSLRVRNGQITYTQIRRGRDTPGVLTFDRISALATRVSHVDRRTTAADEMTLVVLSYLQNHGEYRATFIVPLDAPTYAMQYHGTLGAMPIGAINAFTQELFAVHVTGGRTQGIVYDVQVRGGVAVGSVTPRYDGFAVSVQEEGATGMMAAPGVLGRAVRGIAGYTVRQGLRPANPEHDGLPVRVGAIQYAAPPTATLPQFFWNSLRYGLTSVVRK